MLFAVSTYSHIVAATLYCNGSGAVPAYWEDRTGGKVGPIYVFDTEVF